MDSFSVEHVFYNRPAAPLECIELALEPDPRKLQLWASFNWNSHVLYLTLTSQTNSIFFSSNETFVTAETRLRQQCHGGA